jgi:predicted metallopeptidase
MADSDGSTKRPGRLSRSFDYTGAVDKVCTDICFRVPELNHIDMSRVAIAFSQTRHSAPFGVFAATIPLRFKNGESLSSSRGKNWKIQRCVRPDGVEYLYILNFFVPRFIDLKFKDKLETVVHELYHINPDFNGDFRRFRGRCFAHGSSLKRYDAIVRTLVEKWLKREPPPEIWDFLSLDYRGIVARFGGVHGTRIPMPKVIPAEPVAK